MIPAASFIRVLDEDSPNSLENTIIKTQQQYRPYLEQLELQGVTYQVTTSSDEWWKDQQKDRLTIPPDDTLKQLILRTWHSSPAGRHLGRDETTTFLLGLLPPSSPMSFDNSASLDAQFDAFRASLLGTR